MSVYADTGFICSIYAPDANTERATAQIEKVKEGILFSWLNQVEFRNALRLRIFRKEITPKQRDASFNWLHSDLNTGVFSHVHPAHSEVMVETERLSALHSEKFGNRSLDILHVAMALASGSETFLSFDKRQINLARAAGLGVPRM